MTSLVTAVMITGLEGRQRLARAALTAYANQTYKHRELVIVDDGQEKLLSRIGSGIKYVRCDPGRTLGELRNVALSHAQGDWICQWDDDDWYHHDRIRYQVSMSTPGKLCTLRYQLRHSFQDDETILWKWDYPSTVGIPGTMLFPNDSGLRFRHEPRHEDSHFVQDHFVGRATVAENSSFSHCYIRFYHGKNTWSKSHVMGQGRPQPDQDSLDYARSVIDAHYRQERVPLLQPVSGP